MKIGIVKKCDRGVYTVNDQLVKLLEKDHQVIQCDSLLSLGEIPDAHTPRFSSGKNNKEMIELTTYLESMGSQPVNSAQAFLLSSNKHLSHLRFQRSGILQPNWALVQEGEPTFWGGTWRGRTIKKPLVGGGGKGIEIYPSFSQALDSDTSEHLLQPYVPHRALWRVIVSKEGVLAAYQKETSDEIASVRMGAQRKYLQLPPEAKDLALSMLLSLGLDIAGMDLLETGSGFLALESNSNFDFPEEEEVVLQAFCRILESAAETPSPR